jgi:hypothetical protein
VDFVNTSVKIANLRSKGGLYMPDVLIDTGVIFALLPFQSLEYPGVKPGVKHRLRTADGRIVERDGASVLSGDSQRSG